MKEEKDKNNVIKMKTPFETRNFIHTKKLKIILAVTVLAFIILLVRIGFLQFIQGGDLKEQAYNQQAINKIISPKRGNIYDSTGKALAIGAQVDTITINPKKFSKDDEEAEKEYQEKVAKGLSEIFELDYEETLKKVSSDARVETIAKKVEKEKVDELRDWMKKNKVSVGINIDEDTNRYYPYGSVASAVIGFCGSDNQGLAGIESKWDSVLTGTPGKIVSSKGGDEQEIPNAGESYISAENGSDLTLTIDLNIQSIVEKYLKQAVENNNCKKGGNVIAMDPKTGDILAMANYPNYDLNTPYTPNETLAKTYETLSSEEKTEALYRMWSNKSVADTYEPGSVFKIITSAIALEENVTSTDVANDFICKGYEEFPDTSRETPIRVNCWKYYDPHGSLTLRRALMASCNPAFMQLGKRIGAQTLYKYYEAFGLLKPTNSGLYGEQSSIFHKIENLTPVDLAIMSFGQRINVTPMQMITATACIANDGILVQPRIVKSITNTDTGATVETPVTEVRQVLSKETSREVKSMMESVVTEGTGKLAAVDGYSIGGKTGTSEPIYTQTDGGYVGSYVAIAPTDDTKIVLLVTLYDLPEENHQGGSIAGPIVAKMLSEILPYLGIPSSNTNDTQDNNNLVTVPDVRNKTVTEAEKVLKDAGFTVKSYVNGDANSLLVKDQTPKPGNSLAKNSVIILYGEGSEISTSIAVPDVTGMSAYQATNTLKSKNLNISIEGVGVVVSQDYTKDEQVQEGTIINVVLKQETQNMH